MDEYEKVLLRSIISSSSFDISIMGDVLSKLAYGTEYKDFTYHEAKHTTVKGRSVPTTTNVCMILNQLYKLSKGHISYSDAKDSYENVDHICKYGNGVVLYMGESIPTSISFYKKDEKGDLTKTVDFSLLPYMQDFIDFVIDCIIMPDRLPIHTSGTNPKCILLCINQLQEVHEAKHSLCSVLSQRLSQPL